MHISSNALIWVGFRWTLVATKDFINHNVLFTKDFNDVFENPLEIN